MGTKRLFDRLGRAISDSQPNDFGRETAHYSEITEVGVFRNDDEIMLERVVPYFIIGRAIKTDKRNVAGFWAEIGHSTD